jgi:hypothetical protein
MATGFYRIQDFFQDPVVVVVVVHAGIGAGGERKRFEASSIGYATGRSLRVANTRCFGPEIEQIMEGMSGCRKAV